MSIGSIGVGKRKTVPNVSAASKSSAGGVCGYKVAEIASMLRISENAAYDLIAAGMIPSVRTGRLIRVPVEAFHEKFGGMIPSVQDWLQWLAAGGKSSSRRSRKARGETNGGFSKMIDAA